MYKAQVIEEFQGRPDLPEPVGFQLLIGMPKVSEATEGGVIMPDDIRHREEVAAIVGMVIATGPDVYSDKKRFPSGPWCELGDSVIFRTYSGTKVKLKDGQVVRLINDDTVQARVEDPRMIERG